MIADLIKSCNEKLAEDPENIQLIRMRGLLYDMLDQYDEAIEDYIRAIKALPNDAVVYYLKSNIHYRKGEFNMAKRDYLRGLKIQHNANFTEEQIERAVVKDDEELEDIRRVIEHEKNEAIRRYFDNQVRLL